MVTPREPERLVEERLGPFTLQLLVFEELQEIVAVLPDCTRVGVAEIVAVG